MERVAVTLAGASGFLAVALGAFGAHGLKARLASAPDGAERLAWWSTAAQYHLVHALALLAVAWLAGKTRGPVATVALVGFTAGTVLFSGSLYAMTLTGVRALGAVTPLGGLAFLVGWAAVAWLGLKLG